MFYLNLFRANETDFSHNEMILTSVTTALVKEVINGVFILNFSCLNSDYFSKEIVVGAIIKCRVADERKFQLFRITAISRDLETVSATCSCIGQADLATNFVPDCNVVTKNRVQALRHILSNTLEKHKFTVTGDENSKVFNNLRIVRYSPLNAIFGTDSNTMVNRYGGEYQFDNFNIRAVDQIGSDNGVIIAHGKNVLGIEEKIDDSKLVTRIIPMYTQRSEAVITIPEYYIDSEKINDYSRVYHSCVSFSDLGIPKPKDEHGRDTDYDEATVIERLKILAKEMFTKDKVDEIEFTYNINFVELSKTEEYKNYKILETVSIGDVVTIMSKKLGINLVGRVQEYEYDAIADRYTSIRIGSSVTNITDVINKTQASINKSEQKFEISINDLENKLSSSLTMTADEIKTMVKDENNKLSSSISQTAQGLQVVTQKYDNGILKGQNYNFTGDGFVIGSTNGSTTATHTSDYSEWRHGNSYSRADANGFSRDGRPYHHLIAMGYATVGGAWGVYPQEVTIQLPNEWKGKAFTVVVQMVDTAGGITDEFVKRTYLRVTDVNTAQGTFRVRGYWTAINWTKAEMEKELTFSYIAVGG